MSKSWIPKFINRLLRNTKCCIHGDGSNRRHYLHVLDTVAAFDIVLHKGVVGETYNIGSPDEFTNMEVAKKLISIIKGECDYSQWIEYVHDRAFNDSRYYLTFQKLSDSWTPTRTFDESLTDVVNWYRGVDIKDHWSHDAVIALEPHPK